MLSWEWKGSLEKENDRYAKNLHAIVYFQNAASKDQIIENEIARSTLTWVKRTFVLYQLFNY